MLIGEVSKMLNISPDTIRYYISIGLLYPSKKYNKYMFDNKDIERLREIGILKSMDFSLRDIYEIIGVGKAFSSETEIYNNYVINKFTQKHAEINSEIKTLKSKKKYIHDKVEQMKNKEFVDSSKNLNTSIISNNFYCPDCFQPLCLSNNNASVTCTCGYVLTVENGIICVSEYINKETSKFFDERFLNEVIMSLDRNPLNKSIDEYHDALKQTILDVIHPNSHIMIFGYMPINILKCMIGLLDYDSVLYFVDDSFEGLRYMKYNVDALYPSNNTIFIHSNHAKIPVKDESVDLIIDILKSSSSTFLPKCCKPLCFRKKLRSTGMYLLLNGIVSRKFVAANYFKNYDFDVVSQSNVKEHFISLGFKPLKAKRISTIICEKSISDETLREYDIPLRPDDSIEIYSTCFSLTNDEKT